MNKKIKKAMKLLQKKTGYHHFVRVGSEDEYAVYLEFPDGILRQIEDFDSEYELEQYLDMKIMGLGKA